MRWPRPRLTVRRLMVLVLVLGVGLHLAITARRVRRQVGEVRSLHVHSGILEDDFIPAWASSLEPPPFWPAYGRALVGRTWKDWPLGRPCKSHPGWFAERCELASPEIRTGSDPGNTSFEFAKDQKDTYLRMAREKGRDVGYDEDGNVVHKLP